jgi:hypothetical protein
MTLYNPFLWRHNIKYYNWFLVFNSTKYYNFTYDAKWIFWWGLFSIEYLLFIVIYARFDIMVLLFSRNIYGITWHLFEWLSFFLSTYILFQSPVFTLTLGIISITRFYINTGYYLNHPFLHWHWVLFKSPVFTLTLGIIYITRFYINTGYYLNHPFLH